MKDSNKIQSFQSGDEEEIVRVFEAAFGKADYYFPRSVSSWVWRYVQRPGFDPESILMIRKENTLVAALSMTYGTMMVNNEPRKIALIDDVSTDPQWQKQGFATALLKHAIARAKELGCCGIHLSADPEGSAIRIYRNVGFEVVTFCINMLSVLKHRHAARLGKRRQVVPLLALSLLDAYKSVRIDKNLCQVEIVEGSTAGDVVQRAQNEFELRNGTLLLDAEYVKWMTGKRPDGALKVASITKDNEFSGMFTVSSSDFSGPRTTDRMAVIGNLTLSGAMQTKNAIAAALHGAKEMARNMLNCPMINMFVDQRDELLRHACKKAGFIEIGKSASMIHPLNMTENLAEIKEGVWSQPVETTSSNP